MEGKHTALPTIRCGGQDVPHNTQRWEVKTNRHPTTNGRSWGWIEGAPGNVCWSNDSSSFDYPKACEVTYLHNQWLEEQKPISLRLIEANKRATAARKLAESARKEADKRNADLDAALAEVARLEALQESSALSKAGAA